MFVCIYRDYRPSELVREVNHNSVTISTIVFDCSKIYRKDLSSFGYKVLMCSGSKNKLSPNSEMEAGFQEFTPQISPKNCSKLLELAATDDLPGFIHLVEEKGCDINESSYWYGRSYGSKRMGFEERTPIMIASMYGSTEVLKYILGTGKVDVNKACGSDGATPLHCTAAGGSWPSVEIIKLLIAASGDITAVDAAGKRPGGLIAPCINSSHNSKRRTLELLLNGVTSEAGEEMSKKKEYSIDAPLPDINEGIYSTDEFRMYSFKVKPCSRAYSHDWTECPFVHPGENARRRDPRKYTYTCVPCPDFKKGICAKNDSCEFAHGVFESWLHPTQYRTRLCKDETGCPRKVCFFAHKPEELRPNIVNSLDFAASSPPISPSAACSSPMWQNKMNITPPALQLPGSRLKTVSTARDVNLDMELLGLENIRTPQMAGVSSPYRRMGGLTPTNLEDVFASPTGVQIRQQNTNPIRASYPSRKLSPPYGFDSSAAVARASYPSRKLSPPYGFDSSAAVAAAVMSSRSTAFAKRSQSFVDRVGAVGGYSPASPQAKLSDWGSPDGRLDWGFNGDDMSKLKKSASFGIRSGGFGREAASPAYAQRGFDGEEQSVMPHWVEHMYMEQMEMVA